MESESKLSIKDLTSSASTITFIEESKTSETEAEADSTYPTWTTRTRGLLAIVCLITSFSTVLRFIFSLGLYGCVILVPYLTYRILIGMPVVLMEIMRGRYVTGSFMKIYSMCPFHLGQMQWTQCEKPWADINCFERKDNTSALFKCIQLYNKTYCQNLTWESSGKQYWKKVVVDSSVSEPFGFSVLYLSFAIATVVFINYKGIRSLEKTLTFFIIIPVTLAFVLNLVTYLTPGSVLGFRFIWSLNVSCLMTPDLWITSLTDTIRTLSVGLFVLPFLSSHGKFTDDIYYDALTIFSSELFCFVLAIPLLSLIISLDEVQPIFKDDFDVYIKISEIFLYYPFPKILWAFIFYLNMTLLELGSQSVLCLSLFEAGIYIFKERFTFSYLLIMLGIALFLFSIPFIFFPTIFLFSAGNLFLLVVFLDLVSLEIFYGIGKFNDDFHFMMGYHPSFYFSFSLFCSTILLFIFLIISLILKVPQSWLKYEFYIFPSFLLLIFIVANTIRVFKSYKKGKVMHAFKGNPDWGPSLPILKKSRIVFDSKTITKEYMYRQELNKKPLMKPNDFAEQNIVHLI